MKATRPLLSYIPTARFPSASSKWRRHLNLKHSLVYVNVRLSGFNWWRGSAVRLLLLAVFYKFQGKAKIFSAVWAVFLSPPIPPLKLLVSPLRRLCAVCGCGFWTFNAQITIMNDTFRWCSVVSRKLSDGSVFLVAIVVSDCIISSIVIIINSMFLVVVWGICQLSMSSLLSGVRSSRKAKQRKKCV